MNTKCLLPLAFFTLFISNVFAQDPCTMPPPQPLVIDSLGIEPFGGQGCSSIHAYISGGTPPYTYQGTPDTSWGFYSTYVACSEGVHCIIATDVLGCSVTSCFLYQRIATGGQLQIDSIDYQVVICEGDCESALVYISGGEPPYEFTWSDGTQSNNGLFEYCSGGEYGVTVTDATGIMAIGSFEVEMYPELSLELQIEAQAVDCDVSTIQTEISVIATGGVPPYEYSWNGGEFDTISTNNLPGGMHTVVVRDGVGCTAMIEFTLPVIVILQPLEVEVAASENTATAIPSGGLQPYTYQWDDYDAQTTATATGLSSGVIYYVTVTDANGCSVIANVVLSVGIEMPEYLTNFDIFPNPSDGKFAIDLQFEVTQRATIQILNSLGQEMYQFTDTQSRFLQTVDMHEVAAGTYFVMISTENGRVTRRVAILE